MNKIVFKGTAKLNEKTGTLWAGGVEYTPINKNDTILYTTIMSDQFPNICPFAKHSNLHGVTIYDIDHKSKAENENGYIESRRYFVFEIN